MAANKTQAVKNLKKKKTKGRKPRAISKQEMDFAAHYVFSGKPVESAIYAGIPVTPYIYQILQRPAVAAYVVKLRAEAAEHSAETARAKFELTGELIDIQVAQRLTKKKMSDHNFVNLAEVAYKSIDRIKPARTVVSQTAAAAMGLSSANGSSMYQVYKSKWLREKEAEMSQRAESEQKALINAGTEPGSTSTT